MLSLPSSWFCHTAKYFDIILVSLHACSACFQGWASQLHSHWHFQHALHHCLIVSLLQICCQYSLHRLSSSFTLTKSHWRYFIIIMAIYTPLIEFSMCLSPNHHTRCSAHHGMCFMNCMVTTHSVSSSLLPWYNAFAYYYPSVHSKIQGSTYVCNSV